jgi:hypothetical protein
LSNPLEGPEFEVWNHLDSGWQMAYDDMARQLEPEAMHFFESVASLIVGATSVLHLDREMSPIREKLQEFAPAADPSRYDALFSALLELYQRQANPWLKHAVELKLARGGLDRATEALRRFTQLAPQLNQRPLPERAEPYLREAIQTFLFGFDPACISLCRSALEQVSRDVLVRIGVYTEPQLRRAKPPVSLETLLLKLRAAGALEKEFAAADRIRERGNTVLHQHMYDERVRKQVALDTVVDLASVLREVLP